ncbi:MAG: GspH/FimT family pseudopilin [Rubrivivax sp.]|nr:GspH/FimT family pseudopilin [Rubrivivax sp.]
MRRHCRRESGFTLIELLIVVALVAVVLALAAPSFKDFILMQRLKGINAQLVTDLQFARSEAVSRRVEVHLKFRAAAGTPLSCYILYTKPAGAADCNCAEAVGARCVPLEREIRTVQVPTSQSVFIAAIANQADNFAFDPRTGGIAIPAVDFIVADPNAFSIDTFIDGARKLRDTVGLSGRVKVCIPAGSNVQGDAC